MAELRDRLRILDEASVPDQWREIEGRSPGRQLQLEPPPWRRVAAATVAVVVAVAGTVLAVSALTPGESPDIAVDTSSWTTHEVPQLRLTFRHPPSWYVQPFDEMVGHAGFAGAVVSNTEHTFRHPDLGPNSFTSAWDLRGLPANAVIISIEGVKGGRLMPPEARPDTERPLDLDRAAITRTPGLDEGWEEHSMPFVLAGLDDYLRVWFGPDASVHDREAVRQIVASIASIAPETFDGWLVDVDVVHSGSGPVEIEVGPVREAPENEAHPWIQHTVVLRNTGDVPLSFDDTRVGKVLGRPDPELYAADEGCGYAQVSEGSRPHWSVCLSYLDAFVIPPHGVERKIVTLFKGLPGLAPLHGGAYDFAKVYRFRIGDAGGEREVQVRLIYRIREA